MELKIESYELPSQIQFNFEELKAELAEKVSIYESIVYTDDKVKEAKNDRANLNKLKKALNDERIRREKEYMVPFNVFKDKVNELIKIIDKPILAIDTSVKAFEEQQKAKKKEEITSTFNSMEHPDWLELSKIFDEKWLNASVSISSVVNDMSAKITKVYTDLDTLAELPDFGFEAQQIYKSSLDLNNALNEGKKMAEIAKAKAEAEAKAAELAMNPPIVDEQLPGQVEFTDAKTFDEVMEKPVEQPKQWVKFQAYITIDQAKALKKFFDDNAIEFKAI